MEEEEENGVSDDENITEGTVGSESVTAYSVSVIARDRDSLPTSQPN